MASKPFDEVFKAKRRELGPGKTFTWQGKKYTTDRKDDSMDDLAPRGNLPSPEDDATEGGPTQRNSPRYSSKAKGLSLPSDRATDFRSQGEETGMTPDERASAARKGMMAAASLLPAGRAVQGVKNAKRMYDIGKRVTAMPEAAQKTAFLRAARAAKEVDGMRRGGSVSSASKRADGCATKGKTRGKFV